MATRNVYRLPANYLRKAPQDPKAGVFSWLGAPGNRQADDWTYEGNYLMTLDGGPIVFRFIADLQNVADFDDMFCEALSCRLIDRLVERENRLVLLLQFDRQRNPRLCGHE